MACRLPKGLNKMPEADKAVSAASESPWLARIRASNKWLRGKGKAGLIV